MQWNCRNFFFFLQFYCAHNYLLFCIKTIQISNLFQSPRPLLYKFLPCFIIKIFYKMHIIHCLNIAWSLQFQHAINIPTSYPLKFGCHGCWQNIQKKIVAKEKFVSILPLVTHSDDLNGGSVGRFFNVSWLRLESTTNETVWTAGFYILWWKSVSATTCIITLAFDAE